jgi:hypothetical protein
LFIAMNDAIDGRACRAALELNAVGFSFATALPNRAATQYNQ